MGIFFKHWIEEEYDWDQRIGPMSSWIEDEEEENEYIEENEDEN